MTALIDNQPFLDLTTPDPAISDLHPPYTPQLPLLGLFFFSPTGPLNISPAPGCHHQPADPHAFHTVAMPMQQKPSYSMDHHCYPHGHS